jgi:hypothetical protein
MVPQYIWPLIFIMVSYESEKNIQQKLAKFSQILVILNNNFKSTLV